ncbi:related to cellulose binding protein CEL1 [Serendipita indica DSM 11827]|uniref:lytic cellulose monooxygenase (C4-dehydrogenating) n=1 Tax=Serendipita indica (strain DSM 11827) TaxID=1109443 RepID=G4TZC8_SERID|nr:related to cellulose binding protein CEL1 [Serendipita indica DSM 11827]
MKLILSVAYIASVLQLVSGHYGLPNLIVNGTTTSDWQYVRMTANHWSSAPVTDVTSQAIRCYEDNYSTTPGATFTATVAAGSTVGFKANNVMGHPGYFSAYMSKASPAANSPSAGTGNTWFKIWEWSPTYSSSTGLTFASAGISQFTFTIPKSLPSGQYLLRGEQIALHLSGTTNGAQFYLACAQLNVSDNVGRYAQLSLSGRERRKR